MHPFEEELQHKYNDIHTENGQFGFAGGGAGGGGGTSSAKKPDAYFGDLSKFTPTPTSAQLTAAKSAITAFQGDPEIRIESSFHDMHPALVPAMTAHISMMMKEYPETAKTIEFIGTPDLTSTWSKWALNTENKYASSDDSFAYATKNTITPETPTPYQTITLNPAMYANIPNMEELNAAGTKSGWVPGGVIQTPETVFTHEFGHTVNARAVNMVLNPEHAQSVTTWQTTSPSLSGVSGYARYAATQSAKSGQVEGFAESFTQMQHASKLDWVGSTWKIFKQKAGWNIKEENLRRLLPIGLEKIQENDGKGYPSVPPGYIPVPLEPPSTNEDQDEPTGVQEKYNEVHTENGEFGFAGGGGGGGGTSNTQKTLEETLHAKYPATTFSFEGVHPDLAQSLGTHIDTLMSEYPDTAKTLNYIGVPGKLAPAFAVTKEHGYAADPNGYMYQAKQGFDEHIQQAIIVNPRYFARPDVLAKVQAVDQADGWSPKGVVGTPQTLMTHEFGHAVNWNTFENNEEGATLSHWQDAHLKQGASVSGYAKAALKQGKLIGELEAFAEGFTQIRHAPQSTWGKYTTDLAPFLQKIHMKNTELEAASDLFTFSHSGALWIEPYYGPRGKMTSFQEELIFFSKKERK